MKKPLTTLFISLPLIVGATGPSIKITSPTKSPNTNGVLNAAGTASGAEPITNYYSLNGADPAQATGSNTWNASDLLLTPGPNTFSAYAQDANGALSKTNTVSFFYVVNLPIIVETNGAGTVSPNYNGKLLEIGKKYSLSAKAAKGFTFTNWAVYSGEGVIPASLKYSPLHAAPAPLYVTNSAHFSFTMASNLTFVAKFLDSTRPVCAITSPAAKHSVSNSPITVTVKATDNVGVTAVNYNLNGTGWNLAVQLDPTNWQAANLTLNVGSNSVQAYALDAAQNASLTNTINFNYVSNGPAPLSLAGMVAHVTIDGDSGPFQVCFGQTTFAQTSTNGNEGTKAGTYTYNLLGTDQTQAQLSFTTVVPPSDAGPGGGVVLVFTDTSTAIFTNENSSMGFVTLTPAANLAPSPSTIITAQSLDMSGNTNTIVIGGGMFTNSGPDFADFGTYTFTSYSPQDVVLTENFTDPADSTNTGYVQLDFSSTTNGLYFYSQFDNFGDQESTNEGPFTVLSSAKPPAGIAPDSLAGDIWNVSPNNKGPFQFCFGASTYSRSSKDTNENDVGVYSFIKTGAGTAIISDSEVAPSGNNGGNNVYITYSSSSSATFMVTNNDNGNPTVQTGTIKISSAGNFAPPSIAGRTISAFGGSATFNQDGTVTFTSGSPKTYTYAVYSPEGALVVSSNLSDGSTNYIELTFTSSGGGNIFITAFDNSGNPPSTQSGTFTIR